MRVRFSYWVPLGLFVVVAIVLWKGLQQDPHQLPSTLLHQPFPSQASNHHPDWKGRVVFLNVFASWCLSCQIEHPELMDIASHSKEVRWVGLDYMDKKASMQAFLSENGSPYDEIIDDPEGKLAIDLGVYGVPETFVIDQQGLIRYRHAGPLTEKVWQSELRPLLEQLGKK